LQDVTPTLDHKSGQSWKSGFITSNNCAAHETRIYLTNICEFYARNKKILIVNILVIPKEKHPMLYPCAQDMGL